MIKGLSEEGINELPDDARVWFVVDKAKQEDFISTPDIDREWVLWTFLKREDAEHYAHLIMKMAPPYRGKELIATDDLLKDIRESAVAQGEQIEVISPNEARIYFKEYEEFLADYYNR